MAPKYSHVGEAIKARRELLGLRQEDVCERMGWKSTRISEISEIEKGRNTNLTLNRLAAFAQALDCHVGDLVFMLNTRQEETV